VFGLVEDPNAPVARRVPQLAFDLRETAEALSLSIYTVRRLRERGLLRNIKGVRHLRFSLREIERFLADTTKEI